ncbi:MAG: DUF4129 domain-containing protein [Candidatus Bipolaricaulaceae bacterium]
MRKRRFAIFGILLVLVLIFLAWALNGTEFRGGRPFPAANTKSVSAPVSGSPIPGDWAVDLLRITFFLGLVLASLALVLSRNFRKHALYLLITLLTFVCAWYLLSRLSPSPSPAPVETPSAGNFPEEGGSQGEGLPKPPHWAIYLAALVLGLGLSLWLGPKLAKALEQKHTKKAIQDVAQEAVAELKRGLPVDDVVLRAWLRMVELLTLRSGMRDQPHLTPREFAESLKKLGFKHEAVDILTKLFEEVRYGHKESGPRREQALDALAALERAFA